MIDDSPSPVAFRAYTLGVPDEIPGTLAIPTAQRTRQCRSGVHPWAALDLARIPIRAPNGSASTGVYDTDPAMRPRIFRAGYRVRKRDFL